MKSKHHPQFDVRKTEKFIQKIHSLKLSYDRITELVKSVEWHLARRPHFFTALTGEYYLLKTLELSNDDFPELRILYRIDDENKIVMLIDVDD